MMRYYSMKLERNFSYAPSLTNCFLKFDARNISKEKGYLLPKRELLGIRANKETIFTDIVTAPFLLVSEAVKEILEAYEPTLKYKEMVLLDTDTPKYALYYLPILDIIDCLSREQTKFNAMGVTILEMAIDKDKVPDKSIFKLVNGTANYILVRLDLAESLLRRDLLGIGLTKVVCV